MDTVNDNVMGTMTYNHLWQKTDNIIFWNKSINVTINVKAYRKAPITDVQRKSYEYFKENISKISAESQKMLIDYFTQLNRTIDIKTLNDEITLKNILFDKDGSVILFCDDAKDIENGIAIKVYPSYNIGTQDMFL